MLVGEPTVGQSGWESRVGKLAGRQAGTMGCHPMLTENANFLTNAL